MLEGRVKEEENRAEQLEAAKLHERRLFELKVGALEGTIAQLEEALGLEKEQREGWVEKFEDEQRALTAASAEAMRLRSRVKDLELELTNEQISLKA